MLNFMRPGLFQLNVLTFIIFHHSHYEKVPDLTINKCFIHASNFHNCVYLVKLFRERMYIREHFRFM